MNNLKFNFKDVINIVLILASILSGYKIATYKISEIEKNQKEYNLATIQVNSNALEIDVNKEKIEKISKELEAAELKVLIYQVKELKKTSDDILKLLNKIIESKLK